MVKLRSRRRPWFCRWLVDMELSVVVEFESTTLKGDWREVKTDTKEEL